MTVGNNECEALFSLGKRILVMGSPGAGKTEFSKKLNIILNKPLYHLDDYYWQEGGKRPSEEQWRAILLSILKEPAWIIDGNYANTISLRAQYTDSVIILMPKTHICLWRIVKRGIIRMMGDKSSLPKSLKESNKPGYLFDLNIRFIKKVIYFKKRDRQIVNNCLLDKNIKIIELYSESDKSQFLSALKKEKSYNDSCIMS